MYAHFSVYVYVFVCVCVCVNVRVFVCVCVFLVVCCRIVTEESAAIFGSLLCRRSITFRHLTNLTLNISRQRPCLLLFGLFLIISVFFKNQSNQQIVSTVLRFFFSFDFQFLFFFLFFFLYASFLYRDKQMSGRIDR